MIKAISTFCFVLLAGIAIAQDAIDYPAHNPGWEVDLNKAYKMSQESGKPILVNFTGSDWCGWCVRLTNSVFSKDEFKSWAKKNVILLEVDFPRRKKLPAALQQQNVKMQQAMNVRGFPTVHVMDVTKNKTTGQFQYRSIARTGYKRTVGEFTADLERTMK